MVEHPQPPSPTNTPASAIQDTLPTLETLLPTTPLDNGTVAATHAEPAPHFRRRLSPSLLATSAVAAVALAFGIGATGFAVGSQHAALGPVRVATAPAAESTTWAQQVYRAAQGSVVAISVDAGGSGTGFFYRPDRIVTNAHVVSSSPAALRGISTGGKFTVNVRLADGRERKGTVIALDARTDLAIIEVPDGLGVRPLELGDSAKAEPGQPVAVLGHPFGQGLTMTTGIVTTLARNSGFASSEVQSLLLQTDAAVNPGNSGGPMLDATGAVLGIVTLRPDSAEGRDAEGVALALPANQIRAALTALEKTGKVAYPLMGVSLRNATSDDKAVPAAWLGKQGVVVVKVSAGSGADKAGIREGDVVVRVAGKPVASSAAVVDAVAAHQPGQRLSLDVLTPGKGQRTVSVTLGSR